MAETKFKPGERPVGRTKGTPNKTTAALKDMILKALDGVGGVDYLQAQAHDNPGPFLTLVGKVLPMTVAGDPNAPISIDITRRIVDANPRPRDA